MFALLDQSLTWRDVEMLAGLSDLKFEQMSPGDAVKGADVAFLVAQECEVSHRISPHLRGI